MEAFLIFSPFNEEPEREEGADLELDHGNPKNRKSCRMGRIITFRGND